MYFEVAVFDICGVLKLLPLVTTDGRGGFDGVIGAAERFFGGNELLALTEPLLADGGT